MFLNNSGNMSNMGGKKQQRWRDYGKMIIRAQIPDPITGPIPSTEEHMNKDRYDGEGSIAISRSFEISKEESQAGYPLSNKGRAKELVAGKTRFFFKPGAKFQVPVRPEEPRQWEIQEEYFRSCSDTELCGWQRAVHTSRGTYEPGANGPPAGVMLSPEEEKTARPSPATWYATA